MRILFEKFISRIFQNPLDKGPRHSRSESIKTRVITVWLQPIYFVISYHARTVPPYWNLGDEYILASRSSSLG